MRVVSCIELADFLFRSVLCVALGSRRMGSIWLRAVTVRRRYMIPRRVRKFGKYFSRFLTSFSTRLLFFWPYYLDLFPPMTYYTFIYFFFHIVVFWQTTLLKDRMTSISEVFVSVLMASIWLLERKIRRSR